MADFLDQVRNIGETIYNYSIGWLANLPSLARAIISILVVFLAAVGLIRLLTKSFKIFGTIIVVLIIAAIVLGLVVK